MPEITRRTLIGAVDRTRVAIVTIPVPAGGEVDLKPWWSFTGWADEVDTATGEPLNVERLRRAVVAVDHAHPGHGWVEDVAKAYEGIGEIPE